MRVAGYVRVSTAGQVDGESLATQRERIITYARAHGYELAEIYADEGISGATTKKRPGFQKLLKDSQEGRFERLIVCDLSRFGRNIKELLNSYDKLEGQGVKLVFLKESVDTSTAHGRLFRNLLASFAEYEREVIKERMLGNRTARWKKGNTFIGRVPFGYVWNKEKKRLETNPKEAEIYRRIVSMYVDEGLSYIDIALQLRKEGTRCKKKPFSAHALGYMLKNPIYYGEFVGNRHKYDGNKRTGELKPEDEHISIEAPALISKTRWDQVQAKIDFNKVKGKRVTQAQDHWLRDLLVCELCGGPVKPYTNGRLRKDGTSPRYYACIFHKMTSKRLQLMGRRRCLLPTIKAEEIEGQVWAEIVNTLTCGGLEINGAYQKSKLEELFDGKGFDEQMAHLNDILHHQEAELKTKERAKGRIMGLLESDDFEAGEFRQRLALVKTEVTTIRAAIKDSQEKIQALREARANSERYLEFVRENRDWLQGMREDLVNLAPDDKKALIESLVPGKIPVWWITLEELETGPEWGLGAFPWSFNPAIFHRLASEGKLKGLDKNGSDHPGTPRPHPLEQG